MTKLEEFQKNEKVQQTKRFIIKNIRTICCVGMIVFLFVGNLVEFGKKTGAYVDNYGIKGYNVVFNSASIYGILLLVVPALLLCLNYIKSLEDKQSLVKFVAPMISLAVLVVIRLNVKNLMDSGNGSAYAVSFKSSFGLSGWLYVLFCLILIALGAIEHFKLNVTEESIKKVLKEKNMDEFKNKKD